MKRKTLQEELHSVWSDWVSDSDYGLWHETSQTSTGKVVEAVAGKGAADIFAPDLAPSPINVDLASPRTPAGKPEDSDDDGYKAALERSAKKPASSLKTVRPRHGLNLGPHAHKAQVKLSAGVGPVPRADRRKKAMAGPPPAATPSPAATLSPAAEAPATPAHRRDKAGRLRIGNRWATKAEAEKLGVPLKL